ncbi:hypothetical protein [uncultured Psychroserpens sp.]|uniref:hypothetical protein n=1 Tax=uncultured Psychroserpens sp. TaxID=255436 RepID=UPI00261ED72D|nr:hypothetical protein [uncultured Psychroserpens sp.]
MKAVSVVTIRKELKHKSNEELAELCLRLSRFKKENKELLTYLLFEADSEAGYIDTVKAEIDEQFELINTDSYFYIKKSVRKILRNTKKYIRYSLNKETEVELLLYFCKTLKTMRPSIKRNTTLTNIYERNIEAIKKKIVNLHEDLQYDYRIVLEEIEDL